MRKRALAAIAVFLLAAVPIVLLPFPPVTDLPQHLAQTLTAVKQAGNPSGPFVLLWGAPNTLVYAFIFLLERIFSLEFLGRAVLLALTAAWIFAVHYAAARKQRPPETAVLASVFLFNISFYWGFLNFLTGFPFFFAWFFLTTRNQKNPPPRWYALVVLTSLLLYGSHILWLIVGAVWFGAVSLFRRLPFRSLVTRAAALLPAALLTIFWYPKFAAYQTASHLDETALWITRPFEKLFTLWFKNTTLGGGAGPMDLLAFIFVCAWIAAAVLTNRRDFRRKADTDLLLMAALLFAVSFFAPDAVRNTIYFSGRWAAPFAVFLILALPAPRLAPAFRKAAVWAVVASFFVVTAFRWVAFDRNELTGFRESLARIPGSARILELDFVKASRYSSYRPFLQMSAYAEVFRGAELAYPFARHSTGLVAFREPAEDPWTYQLDWYAERLKDSDLAYFDYVLVNGTPYHHEHRLPRNELTPVTSEGRWRLYRVVKPEVPGPGIR